ncbi:MAG: SUMF1/EgtB/PvdO family nonheme iron enzyme [Thermodesulfobacteriota bacterium]
MALITLHGIDEAISNLNASPDTLKGRLIALIRAAFPSEESMQQPQAIAPEELILALWGEDDPARIRQRRKNLSSLKSALNKALKELGQEGKNPEGIIIGRDYVFTISDEHKDSILQQLGISPTMDAGQLATLFREILGSILDRGESRKQADQLLAELDKAREMIMRAAGHDSPAGDGIDGKGSGAGTGEATGDAGGTGMVVEEVALGENEEFEIIEEIIDNDDQSAEAAPEAADEVEIAMETAAAPAEMGEIEAIDEEAGEAVDEVEVNDQEITEVVDEVEVSDQEITEAVDEVEVSDQEITEAVDEVEVSDQEITEVVDEVEVSDQEITEAVDEVEVSDQEITEVVDEVEVNDQEITEAVDEVEVSDQEITEVVDEVEVSDQEITEAVDEVEVSDQEITEVVDEVEAVEEAAIYDEIAAGEDAPQGEGSAIGDHPSVLPGPDADKTVPPPPSSSNRPLDLSHYLEASEALAAPEQTLAESHDEYVAQILERFMPRFIKIPAGHYPVGTVTPGRDERPAATIWLPGFYISQVPVTNDLFDFFVRETGYETDAEQVGFGTVFTGRVSSRIDPDSGRKVMAITRGAFSQRLRGANWRHPAGPESSVEHKANHPVVQISRRDALAFAAWAGKRLPSEDEWEAAARGPQGLPFPWGNEWRDGLANTESSLLGDTTPVTRYGRGAMSPFGLCDLLGNVFEWTATSVAPDNRGPGPMIHVLKGGCWISRDRVTAAGRRLENDTWSNIIGFRCAV